MPRFNYVALDARGQEATGLVEAASSNAAITQLRQAGYFPTSVIEEAVSSPDGKESRRRAATTARTTKTRAKKGIVLFQRRKVGSKVLMIFTRQLATLVDAGLPLLKSLNVLVKQERDKVLKRTIIKIADSVQRDRKSTRLNSSHLGISYAVFCLKKKQQPEPEQEAEGPADDLDLCCIAH